MSAPGFSGRLASDKYMELNLGPPVRALPELLWRSFEIVFEQVGHQPAFTGFALMLSLALGLTLSVYRPQRALGPVRPAALAKRPLWAGLIAQLLFLPVLWTHTSDATQILGRFSAAFFLVICLNMAQILAFALLLAFSERIDARLRGNESTWRVYITALLLAAAAAIRHGPGAQYSLQGGKLLVVQRVCLALSSVVAVGGPRFRWRIRGYGAGCRLFAVGAALFSYLALIALSLIALGFLSERILAGAAFLHVSSGVGWGLSLGLLLRRIVDYLSPFE